MHSSKQDAVPATTDDASAAAGRVDPRELRSFAEFYPFYLGEHSDRRCRRMHFIGSSLVLLCLVAAAVTGVWALCWLCPLLGYGFAWWGHFGFEHNKPASFSRPLYSLMGDWVMYRDMWLGRLSF
ncbi:DUF962 domain-containing protein [Paucibacter sp. Y2R2-4]|uniref:DUF962 domain-containing protein n=1 Tax=Paucibacter sp. Y2R2-4 TaxID=2893553 RepID=UPI0021E44DFF|nr:DUF962 domain-containing protein [Paucibacter sp. Y2R2-4]MCV2351181.1 DUF962 domain-containing protein [Paucibacter sp. Y2R2-4]